ncbi:RagB/SusD family nutrient uptake outer membrane protein [Mucilaginibacter pedocola]|uniref:Carbohydrate-binding protein SusD n=1 Tax=Mucilaginibacter pedocola TaxID=1792845 RepID=A0A1S9PFQ7_9SPHI|nr:RagB/SusD family nutrient uptake outer membrane protein [Mucilaginibacter pedocola]OOQ59782.1 hypothetical protein BC343_06425 [Mucilaginibacter pedocola]
MKTYYKFWILCLALVLGTGCKKGLDIAPASELSDSFLLTKKGATALLNGVYADGQFIADAGVNRIYVEEAVTDVLVNYRGALNIDVLPFQSFNWLPTAPFLSQFYSKNYTTIRDANILLSNIPNNPELSADEKKLMTAEARFLRGLAYYYLYGWFGPVPMITKPFTSATDDFNVPKAEETELLNFIESELIASANDLPGTIITTGKATKGAALGVLTKFYLQTKNWQKATATAKQVMDMNIYKLQTDYVALFDRANKGNPEMIFVYPALNKIGFGNVWTANALPPQYPTTVFNTATQVCMPLAFYKTFAAADKRRNLILTSYTSTTGALIDLTTGVEYQNPRSLKYPTDPAADERHHGNDFPLIRYADILLSRAEALVQEGAVTQEAVDLLNMVHTRAGLTAFTLTDLPDKNTFITALVKERGWEFYSEGKRREDLLRNGLFLKNATDRGLPAKDFQVRFPFPQSEVDANKKLVQNTGY